MLITVTTNNDNNLMKKKLENENKNFFVKNVIKIKRERYKYQMIIYKKTKKQQIKNENYYKFLFYRVLKKKKFSFNFLSAAVNLISQFFSTSDSKSSSNYCFSIYSSFYFTFISETNTDTISIEIRQLKNSRISFLHTSMKNTRRQREGER